MLVWLFQSSRHAEKNQEIESLLASHFRELYTLTDSNKCTLLHITADYNPSLLDILLRQYDKEKEKEQDDELLELIDKQTWIQLEDRQGNTALHYAVFRNCLAAVKILESHGANYKKCNHNGLSCMHLAAQGGSPALIYRFKEKGLDPDSVDKSGNTPLHWAAHAGMEYSVAALLPIASNKNCQECTGNTPLHIASALGWTRIVRKLILAGSDYSIRNNEGKLPLDLAFENNQDEISQMLRKTFRLRDLLLIRPSLIPTLPELYPSIICVIFTTLTVIPNLISLFFYREGASYILTIVTVAFGPILMAVYAWARFSNPGTVNKGWYDISTYLAIIEENKPKKICFQCRILRPVRSHHCHLCQKCVKVYDHHCPWLNNCIGSENCLLYVLLLATTTVYLLLTLAAHILRMIVIFDYTALTSSDRVHLALGIVVIISSLLLLLPIGYLLIRQMVFSSQGLTTLQGFLKSITVERQEINLRQRRKMMQQALLGKSNLKQTEMVGIGANAIQRKEEEKQIKTCWQNCKLMFCLNKELAVYG